MGDPASDSLGTDRVCRFGVMRQAKSPLAGRTALVTGGSKGIGRAVAERLAAEGASVAINFNRDEEAATALVEAIGERGGHAVAIRADVSRVAEIERLFDAAEERLGPLDIVVANAATFVMKPVTELTEDEFDRVFALNTKGVFFVLQQAARRLRDDGRIIVTSTGGTRMLFRDNAVYLGSKGAVEQFVRGLAQEVGGRRITVNAVLPGFTDTGMLPDRDRAMAAGSSPFRRIGQPEDVGDAIALLAGPDARWVTGQLLGAGGGVF
jgi:3-oxoacyl-[acyl-carrier protein] reductase